MRFRGFPEIVLIHGSWIVDTVIDWLEGLGRDHVEDHEKAVMMMETRQRS